MKRLFKNWTGGRHSPSPRKPRSSRRRHTSRRADMQGHAQSAIMPGLVPATFLGYQHLPDGSLQPVYSAPQPETYQTIHTAFENHGQPQLKSSNDSLVGSQHFCCKCGKARSKHYHMENPVKPGRKAPASCCTSCRAKITNSEPRVKYLQHFCAECGKVRSRAYHNEHPLPEGQTPRPAYCLKCETHRAEGARDEAEWEDLEADDEFMALPRLRRPKSNSHSMGTSRQSLVLSDSEGDRQTQCYVKMRAVRKASTGSSKLSVPDEHRKVSKESIKTVRSFQATVEEAPPSSPETLVPLGQETRPTQKKCNHGQESGATVPTQTATSLGDMTSNTPGITLLEKDAGRSHVHVVYIQPPCYHHGREEDGQSSRVAGRVRPRVRRADSSTTTTSSKQSSRRVAFATPEVSSRHEADADYDRSAVPENHEELLDFSLHAGSFRGDYNGGSFEGFEVDGLSSRPPTPTMIPPGPNPSLSRSFSEYVSTPLTGRGAPRLDERSPPPEYSGPPPKLFSPEEIRRLWEQTSGSVHNRHQQRETTGSRDSRPTYAHDYSSLNRESFAANQRSASEGDYPLGYGDIYDSSRPPDYAEEAYRPDSHGASNPPFYHRRAGDSRCRNDENADPKARQNNDSDSRSSQPRSRNDPSAQGANMYNTSEYSNARSTLSRDAGSSRNEHNMYNDDETNGYDETRPGQSRDPSSSVAYSAMYDSQMDAPSNPRPKRSRTSNSRAGSISTMNNNNSNNNRVRKSRKTRPSDRSQADEPRYQKFEPKADKDRQTSAATPEEAPFTAQERLWTDNPEHARKLREAMERLERAATAKDWGSSKPCRSHSTPDIQVTGSPVSDRKMPNRPNVATPDFHRTRRAPCPDMQGSSSADFGSTKPTFTDSTRNFSSPDFGSSTADFGSGVPPDTFSSDTQQCDFSPNVPADYAPPRPTGFDPFGAATPSPPPPRQYPFPDPRPFGNQSHPRYHHHGRSSSTTATWEHPCGPYCNEFCPDREDHLAREIVEIDSDEEREILGLNEATTIPTVLSKKGSTKSPRKAAAAASSDKAFRLALVRLREQGVNQGLGSGSPAKSVVGSNDYYTASESSCY